MSAINDGPTEFTNDLNTVLRDLYDLLCEKNRKYGDAALNPIRIMSKSDAMEQIKVRMDDKLNRILNQQIDEDEDAMQDLFGYLALYHIAKLRSNR